jgi:hypothetical protein
MITGSWPISDRWWMRAIGVRLCSFSAFSETDHHARGAVADLAGGRRGDGAAFLQQLHAAHAFRG